MAKRAWQKPVHALVGAAWVQDASRFAPNPQAIAAAKFYRWLSQRDGLRERRYPEPRPMQPERKQP